MDSSYVILKIEYDDIRACRVCLSVETKLYDMHETGLFNLFGEFAGVPISQTDGLPQHLCFMCHSLFRKSMVFRNKCRSTQDYLLSVGNEITTNYIKSLDTSHLNVPLNISQIEIIDIPSQTLVINDTNIKEEIPEVVSCNNSQQDCCNVDDTNSGDDSHNDTLVDYDIDNCDEKPINIQNCKANETIFVKAEKLERAKDKTEEKNRKALKRKLLRFTKDSNLKSSLFYQFIIDNYVDNDNSVNLKNINDILDSEDESEKDEEKNTNVDTDELEPNKKLFYNFIKDKYVNRVSEDAPKKSEKVKVKKKPKVKRCTVKEDMVAFAKKYNFELQFLSSREEKYAEMVVRKQSLKYKKGRYKCEFCFFGFQTETVFTNHMALHEPSSGSHLCEVCATRFQRGTELLEHQRRHHMYKYTCAECGKCVPYSTLAKQHYESHKGIKYECEHCGKKYSNYSGRLDHIRAYHATTVCEICYETFQGPIGLRSHNTKIHKNSAVCVGCNKQFESLEAVRRHADTRGACDHTLKPCRKCGFNFTSAELLNDHISKYHTKPKTVPTEQTFTPGRKFGSRNKRCCPCGHKTDYTLNQILKPDYPTPSDPSSLNINIPPESTLTGQDIYNKNDSDSHPKSIPDTNQSLPNPEGDFAKPETHPKSDSISESKIGSEDQNPDFRYNCKCPCKLIVKRRKRKRRVEEVNDVSGEAPKKQKYMCEVCSKNKFQSMSSLREHQLIHTGEKPHQCQVCWKRFRIHSLLQMHMTVHTGERAYKCDSCDKTFKTAPARSRHLLVHTGERRHQCSMCDKRYQTTSCLKTHVKTVHMKIPYPPSRAKGKR